jgi:hypothetical protein
MHWQQSYASDVNGGGVPMLNVSGGCVPMPDVSGGCVPMPDVSGLCSKLLRTLQVLSLRNMLFELWRQYQGNKTLGVYMDDGAHPLQ